MAWNSIAQFRPGERVKDIASGFQGLVMGVTAYPNGCVQFLVKPGVNDKGENVDGIWIDGTQLRKVDAGVSRELAPAVAPAGGASLSEHSRRT